MKTQLPKTVETALTALVVAELTAEQRAELLARLANITEHIACQTDD